MFTIKINISRFFTVIFLTSVPLLHAEQGCDYPGSSFKNLKTKNAVECELACKEHPDCKQWVYVSHWSNCSLKNIAKSKKHKLGFISKTHESGLHVNHDYTAKDMKNLNGVASTDECFSACEKNKECTGVTYLDAYKSCWLKKGPGRVVEKYMYCGEKL